MAPELIFGNGQSSRHIVGGRGLREDGGKPSLASLIPLDVVTELNKSC